MRTQCISVLELLPLYRSNFLSIWRLGLPLTHWGRDKMDVISQTTFSSAFSWMKIFEFRLKFHWSLFLRVQLTIFQHWFRKRLGAVQATSHYLNQWWLIYRRIYASLGLNELRLDTHNAFTNKALWHFRLKSTKFLIRYYVSVNILQVISCSLAMYVSVERCQNNLVHIFFSIYVEHWIMVVIFVPHWLNNIEIAYYQCRISLCIHGKTSFHLYNKISSYILPRRQFII